MEMRMGILRMCFASVLVAAVLAGGTSESLAAEKPKEKAKSARRVPLAELDASLKWIPADAAFYSATLRFREQVEAVLGSRAWQRIQELPASAMLLQMVEAQAAEPDTPAARIQAALENPQVRDLLEFFGEMFSEEFFLYADESIGDTVDLLQQINAANRFGPAIAKITGEDEEIDENQLRTAMLIETLSENVERIRVPNVVAGFKVKSTDEADQYLKQLEMVLNVLLAADPRLQERLKWKEIGASDFLTLSLDGELVPWDQLPLEKLREMETDQGDLDAILARLKAAKLVIALGLRDRYLLVSIGPGTAALERLGEGASLAEAKPIEPLQKFSARRLTAIRYVSQSLNRKLVTTPEDMDNLVDVLREVLPETELKEEQQARILQDARKLADDLKRFIPEAGAAMGFSFLSKAGIESYSYNWTRQPGVEAPQPLDLLKHLGGRPLFAAVGRQKVTVADYDLVARWLQVAYGYFEQYAVPEMPEKDREKFQEFTELVRPLVERADKVTRTMLLPALADGQAGIVLEAAIKTRRLADSLPEWDEAMPLPQPAVLVGISDARLLRKAIPEYVAILNGVLDALREVNPQEVPEIDIPEPEIEKSEVGTVYSYELPGEWGVDKSIVPNVGLSDEVLVKSLFREQTMRLLETTPADLGGVLGKAARPRTMAVYLDSARLLDAAAPWVELAAIKIMEEQWGVDPDNVSEETQKQLDEVLAQVRTALKVLKAVHKVTGETYLEGGATVGHSLVEIRDVK